MRNEIQTHGHTLVEKWFNDNLIDSAYALILFVYDTSPSLKLNSIKKAFSTDFYLLSVP